MWGPSQGKSSLGQELHLHLCSHSSYAGLSTYYFMFRILSTEASQERACAYEWTEGRLGWSPPLSPT